MYNYTMKAATVDEIGLSTWRRLIEILDLSPDNDWENIANYFPQYFSHVDITNIKLDLKKPSFSPSEVVLESLRHNLVPIKQLYACLVDFQLVEACNILEKEYPNDTIYMRPNLNPSNTEPFAINTTSKFDNLNKQDSQKFSEQKNTKLTFKEESNQNDPPLSLKGLLDLYESILPVVYDDKEETNPFLNQYPSHSSFDNNLPIQFNLMGKFNVCHIEERKLIFRKKDFNEPYDYLRELKMIKHRHNNLYTTECIMKSIFNPKVYSLLYHCDKEYPSKLLTIYAEENYSTQSPNQFKTENQLSILVDIACALTYLHEKNLYKNQILHGNLQADSILIFTNHPQCTAKLGDFTYSIEMNDSKDFNSEILDEFNRFGLIIYLVSTWSCIDMIECDKIHRNATKHEDLNLYQWELYCSYKMDKHPNQLIIQILWKMFYALTSSNYDHKKGIKKSYDRLNQLMDDHFRVRN